MQGQSSAHDTTVSDVHADIKEFGSRSRSVLYSFTGSDEVETTARGPWVTTGSGKRYLDFGSYAVFILGHRHPDILEAVRLQLDHLPISSRAFPSVAQAAAHKALASFAPPGLNKIMLLNSGAEAVEAALKLARATVGRSGIVHLEKSYHGKTMGALSVTDADAFQGPFLPLVPDVKKIPRDDADAAWQAIVEANPAAVIAEPVQGEGGIFELSEAMLRALRKACDQTGALLIFDEIQCGLNRCGTPWAADQYGIRPDILLAGKALGGGVIPISAVIATPEAFSAFDRDYILHSSTFGGNPLACAAMEATLRIVSSPEFEHSCSDVSARIESALQRLVARHGQLFSEVTGRGLLWGIHCTRPDIAGYFIRNCFAERLLVTPCLTTPHVIRLTPPAFLRSEEIDYAERGLVNASLRTLQDIEN